MQGVTHPDNGRPITELPRSLCQSVPISASSVTQSSKHLCCSFRSVTCPDAWRIPSTMIVRFPNQRRIRHNLQYCPYLGASRTQKASGRQAWHVSSKDLGWFASYNSRYLAVCLFPLIPCSSTGRSIHHAGCCNWRGSGWHDRRAAVEPRWR